MFAWLKNLLPDRKSVSSPRRRTLARSRYLLEALEDRMLLTTYTFTEISHSSGALSPGGFPAINDSGTVAFVAGRNNTPNSGGIFASDGGTVTTIADDSGKFRDLFGDPSINDAGIVAFWAAHDELGDAGIYTSDGTTLTPIVEEIGFPSNFYVEGPLAAHSPSINNNGSVSFIAVGADENTAGVYVSAGGTPTLITDTSGPYSGLSSASINDGGAVAFHASLDAGGNTFVISSGGNLTTIATEIPAGPTSRLGALSSLNASGTVSFSASLAQGVQTTQLGVLADSGGTLTTIAETTGFSRTGGPYRDFGRTSLNDNGLVAFEATLNDDNPLNHATGIFTGPDPNCQTVIKTGQTLAGRTVDEVLLGRESVNNAGQVAFEAHFTDGSRGVYRADPVAGNSPPTADAGPTSGLSYRVQAGNSVMLDASRSSDCDQGAGTLTYEWDFDNDGQFDDATGVTPTFSAAGLNGPATKTIGLRVTDGGGLTSTDTATLFIDPPARPAPGIGNFRATSPILPSASTTLTGTITIDTSQPGKAKVTLTWGDRKKGRVKLTGETTALNLIHQYKLEGTFTITLTLSRNKQIVASAMTTVIVQASAV